MTNSGYGNLGITSKVSNTLKDSDKGTKEVCVDWNINKLKSVEYTPGDNKSGRQVNASLDECRYKY